MEKSPHVLLAGEGAKKFAKEQNVEFAPSGGLISTNAVNALKEYKRHGEQFTEIGMASVSIPSLSLTYFYITLCLYFSSEHR